jgi:Ser/Thr protein kinase RdoA (MazF antagonist)
VTSDEGAARRALRGFAIEGELVRLARSGSGHIHQTFLARLRARPGPPVRFVLQRLNAEVFPDIPAVMENLRRVTAHQRRKLAEEGERDPERRHLRLVPAREREGFRVDEDGSAWRAFHFVEQSRSHDVVGRPSQAREAARAFARFAAQLADLDGPPLADTIPRFHDLAWRAEQLREAAREDACARARSVGRELATAEASVEWADAELGAGGLASLPRRIAHNDCKINNVLFDEASDEALCVIDLDTVMEGTLLADFGELVRTSTCRSPEDEVCLDAMRVEPELYRAVAEGYLEGARDLLRPEELALLPLAGPLLALENALRFLADDLRGDTYFRVSRPRHNLDRARAQLRLFELLRAELGSAGELVAAARGARR